MGSEPESQSDLPELAHWLRAELEARSLSQNQLAVYAGVGQATISDTIHKGHIPKSPTLLRLADYFGISHEEILRKAGHLPPAPGDQEQPDPLEQALLTAFRQLPDDVKPIALDQLRILARLREE